MPHQLIEPHGGALVDLMTDVPTAARIKARSRDWRSWDLTPRQLCDLELLLSGGYSPLRGFLTKADYESVCKEMRLVDGTLWPIPITLDVTAQIGRELKVGDRLALRDMEGYTLGVLTTEDVWQPDLEAEAQQVFGTTSRQHPAVGYLGSESGPWYVGGKVEGLQAPRHYDFVESRLTPAQVRARFTTLGWRKVLAFQTCRPMHRAHQELTFRAAADLEANLLIRPVVGMARPDDVDHYTTVRCCQALLKHFPKNTAMMSLLPLAMRWGGPRGVVWHAIIHKNFGCTHLIVGPDHAVPGADAGGRPFYAPNATQKLLPKHEDELGIKIVPCKPMVYLPDRDTYTPTDEVPAGTKTLSISAAELRERLAEGREIPSWFSFPDVVRELRRTYPPRSKQGLTVFFTGLSGSGKSTIANVLLVKLLEMGGRPVTLWDGDIVRKNLSSELGFSKEHRDINIRRIGFVAAENTKNGGIAICAPIAPYDAIRKANKAIISKYGGYILVYVAAPLSVCEQRDTKGLYAKARAGIIKEFTGISDPYEQPDDADIILDSVNSTPEECAQQIILHLEKEGYIGPTDDD